MPRRRPGSGCSPASRSASASSASICSAIRCATRSTRSSAGGDGASAITTRHPARGRDDRRPFRGAAVYTEGVAPRPPRRSPATPALERGVEQGATVRPVRNGFTVQLYADVARISKRVIVPTATVLVLAGLPLFWRSPLGVPTLV